MKLKSLILFSSILIFFLTANAQTNKVRFKSIEAAGIAGGVSNAKLILQTINGVSFQSWFAGVGFGTDNYEYKSFPLFLDARYAFGENKSFFIYGDAGYNFPGKNNPGKEISYYTDYSFKGGFYSDVGIAFREKISKNTSFFISLGHSFKNLKVNTTSRYECITGPCPADYQKYKLKYGRIILKAGVELF